MCVLTGAFKMTRREPAENPGHDRRPSAANGAILLRFQVFSRRALVMPFTLLRRVNTKLCNFVSPVG
jgi:hypothetical protein